LRAARASSCRLSSAGELLEVAGLGVDALLTLGQPLLPALHVQAQLAQLGLELAGLGVGCVAVGEGVGSRRLGLGRTAAASSFARARSSAASAVARAPQVGGVALGPAAQLRGVPFGLLGPLAGVGTRRGMHLLPFGIRGAPHEGSHGRRRAALTLPAGQGEREGEGEQDRGQRPAPRAGSRPCRPARAPTSLRSTLQRLPARTSGGGTHSPARRSAAGDAVRRPRASDPSRVAVTPRVTGREVVVTREERRAS
jgi:hypothetical protein